MTAVTLTDMLAEKDAAYLERNQVVAALASIFPSGIARTDIPGWLPEWHGCVYIDLPTGQASWHYHDSHAHLFAHLPPYAGKWDGHTTDEKYARLAALPGRDGNQHGQTGVTQASVIASTPIENPALRSALSTLRGWSAEAAGRSGLKDSILLVCNAAESTLPVTLYRIRARGLDAIHAGPVSVSEVGHE